VRNRLVKPGGELCLLGYLQLRLRLAHRDPVEQQSDQRGQAGQCRRKCEPGRTAMAALPSEGTHVRAVG
jgi:hypothetical protein